jgi:hypothetical protein
VSAEKNSFSGVAENPYQEKPGPRGPLQVQKNPFSDPIFLQGRAPQAQEYQG